MKKLSFLFAALIVCGMVLTSCGGGSKEPKASDSTSVVKSAAADSTAVKDSIK